MAVEGPARLAVAAAAAVCFVAGCGGSGDDGDPEREPARTAAVPPGDLRSEVRLPGRVEDALRERYAAELGRGRSVRVGLSGRVQRAALRALAGRAGAAVAADVRTGQVLAWAGSGGVDPARTRVPPGSTYKTVIAAAALDAGVIGPRTLLDGDGRPGVVNAGGERLGPIDVREALSRSSNTAFVDLLGRLGERRLEDAARGVGYRRRPAVDLPRDAVAVSGRPMRGAGAEPFTDADGRFLDPDRLQPTTALQLLTVAASFTGDGVPRWHLASRVGSRPVGAGALRRPWEASTVAVVGRGMVAAVREGTATTLRDLPLPVAAKTGTMPRGDGTTQASIIALAPADRPRWAVAVTVREPDGATGDTAAGPVAAAMIRALARGG